MPDCGASCSCGPWQCAACSPEQAPPGRLLGDAVELRARFERAATLRAIKHYESALDQLIQEADYADAARAAWDLGATWIETGNLRAAIAVYVRAADLARRAEDELLLGGILADLGRAESMVAESPEVFRHAEDACTRAQEISERRHAPSLSARAHHCSGEVAYHRQQPVLALERYRAAGKILEALAEPRETALNLLLVGTVITDLGRLNEARRVLTTSRDLWLAIGDRRQETVAEVAIARVDARLGRNQAALDAFEAAIRRFDAMGDALWLAASLTGVAEVQLTMGDGNAALGRWERALLLFDEVGLQNVAIDLQLSIGETYLARGDTTEALRRFEDGLDRAERAGIERWKVFAWRFIGLTHLASNRLSEAAAMLDQSLQAQDRLGESTGLRLAALTRRELGDVYRRRGELPRAETTLRQSLELSRASGDRLTEAAVLHSLARVALERGDDAGALQYMSSALQLAESIRADVLHRDLRRSWGASVQQWYSLQVDAMLRHDRWKRREVAGQAFEISERARARTLVDGLVQQPAVRGTQFPEQSAREQEVLRELAVWADKRALAADPGELAALARTYADLDYRLQQIDAEIRGRLASSGTTSAEVPLARLRDVQQSLDGDTVLLEFLLGDERSYLFEVTAKGIETHVLLPRGTLEASALRAYDALTTRLRPGPDGRTRSEHEREGDRAFQEEGAQLSTWLLGKVASLSRYRRVVIVADGALHYVPFAALPTPGTSGGESRAPLIERHEIVNVPSATALLTQRRVAPGGGTPRTVAVLADPVFDASDARLTQPRDASSSSWIGGFRTLFRDRPRPPRNGAAAPARCRPRDARPKRSSRKPEVPAISPPSTSTPVAVAHSIPRLRDVIVHLATHGIFDNKDPGASGILLSRFDRQGRPVDGFLALHDIYRIRLPVDLIVLSGCDTALGAPIEGEGLVGMVRAFMHAGARRVVASHWKVEDEATAVLMRRLYHRMSRQGLTPAAALRAAQLDLRSNGLWSSPFYWAAFSIQGEWR